MANFFASTLTAAQIVQAYNGYPIDYKNDVEHCAAIQLRTRGNSDRAWNRPCPDVVLKAKRVLASKA